MVVSLGAAMCRAILSIAWRLLLPKQWSPEVKPYHRARVPSQTALETGLEVALSRTRRAAELAFSGRIAPARAADTGRVDRVEEGECRGFRGAGARGSRDKNASRPRCVMRKEGGRLPSHRWPRGRQKRSRIASPLAGHDTIRSVRCSVRETGAMACVVMLSRG